MEIHINMTAVIVAVVANFIFGFIWYTPLFGKAWGRQVLQPDDFILEQPILQNLPLHNFYFGTFGQKNRFRFLLDKKIKLVAIDRTKIYIN